MTSTKRTISLRELMERPNTSEEDALEGQTEWGNWVYEKVLTRHKRKTAP